MKHSKLEIYTASSKGFNPVSYPDFKIGSRALAKHLNITERHGALFYPIYTKQLLLKSPSELDCGRVPLYVCNCCADLGCGAVTVNISVEGNTYIWSDFAYQGYGSEIFQNEYMKRTGPYIFDKENYISAIQPYGK